jgi:uncharacterized protein YbjT (DUF2867 family)
MTEQTDTSAQRTAIATVLVVGATGSIGRQVVAEAVRQGYSTRALVRDASRASGLDPAAQIVEGQFTNADTLAKAVADVDAVIFTHGSSSNPEAVNYGAVKNVLDALGDRRVRIALMTTIGVTVRSEGHDWKRRGERLVRASGNVYTIVRPGWFDYNDDDQLQITLLQGDTRRAGSSADGVIARHQIARVLVDSLTSPTQNITFELVAERGPAQNDLNPLFAELQVDVAGSVDGVRDPDNMPVDAEPDSARRDLNSATGAA